MNGHRGSFRKSSQNIAWNFLTRHERFLFGLAFSSPFLPSTREGLCFSRFTGNGVPWASSMHFYWKSHTDWILFIFLPFLHTTTTLERKMATWLHGHPGNVAFNIFFIYFLSIVGGRIVGLSLCLVVWTLRLFTCGFGATRLDFDRRRVRIPYALKGFHSHMFFCRLMIRFS